MAPLNAETLMVKTYYGDGLLHLPFFIAKNTTFLSSSSLTGSILYSTVILTPYDYFSYKVF